ASWIACGRSRSGANQRSFTRVTEMRHLNQGRKLNRTSAHRKALFRNLVLALVKHERIKTTDAKAKELRRYAERMVTLGKRGDLAARRLAFAFMQSRDAVKRLFDEIAPRFKE